MTYGNKYVGIRECCRKVQIFLSEAERTAYEASPHPHGEEDGDTE